MLCFKIVRRKFFHASISKNKRATSIAKKALNDVHIVVIGGGLAGLSAASHLLQHGFQRTVLLEASERCGGRVNSKQFGDAFCELGAKWVAIDASKDSIYELLQHASGLQKKIQQQQQLLYVNTLGERINQKLPQFIDTLFHKLCSGIELKQKYRNGADLHDLNSVHTYFQAEAASVVQTLFKEEEREVAGDIFASLFKEFSGLLGCCLEYVNIEHITNLSRHNTRPIYIPTGLDNILNHITRHIDADHMKVGKPVGEIKWHSNSSLEQKSVGCMDGSAFVADHIICTLPLGVLKTFSGYMFKPMLPRDKLNAIHNLGFGSPVKIYLEYKKNVRPWFSANIRPLWSTQERKKDLKWTKQVVEISLLPTSRRVLEIFIGGAFYDEIEKLPDVEVVNEVTKLLRTCLKNPKIPYPESMLRSNWSSCACFLGGRPYFTTGSTVNDVNTLAAPLGSVPSLLFAGDATILQGFGTVDGARMSGIREAQRIIEYYKRLS